MNSEKIISRFNLISNLFLLFMIIFGTLIWADTNGVWHETKDIRGGVFGSDEQDVSAVFGFSFINKVIFSSEVYLNNTLSCSKLSTDNTGKIICNTTSDSVGLKNVKCPSGQVMIGFDINGAILCQVNSGAPIDQDCLGTWNYNYGSCSVSCGPGNYDAQWTMTQPKLGNGAACPNPTFIDNGGYACNLGACPTQPCIGDFNSCSASCGRGTQTFIITQIANGGTACSYSNGYVRECNSQLCLALWTRNTDSIGAAYDVAVDVSGNSYVTGYFSSGSNEYYNTIKYDSNGIKLWNKSYAPGTSTGGYGNRAWGVTVDGSGNVYVTGNSYQGGKDVIYTIKYDSSGNKIWHAIYNIGSSSMGQDIFVDNSGNVYVTGRGQNAGVTNALVVKYNSAGTQQWVKFINSPTYYSEGFGVAVDNLGNSYVTGFVNSNLFLAKFNSAGTEQWKIDNTQVYYGRELAIDSSGNILVAGASNPWLDVLLKYDTNGNSVYFSGYGAYIISGYLKGSYTNSIAHSITIDSNDNIYIAGSSMDGGGFSKGGSMAKFSNTGSPVWQRTDVPGYIVNGIARDSNNKLYTAGDSSGYYTITKYDNYPVLPN